MAFALFVQELKGLQADSGVESVHFWSFSETATRNGDSPWDAGQSPFLKNGDSPWDAGQWPFLSFQGRVREKQQVL